MGKCACRSSQNVMMCRAEQPLCTPTCMRSTPLCAPRIWQLERYNDPDRDRRMGTRKGHYSDKLRLARVDLRYSHRISLVSVRRITRDAALTSIEQPTLASTSATLQRTHAHHSRCAKSSSILSALGSQSSIPMLASSSATIRASRGMGAVALVLGMLGCSAAGASADAAVIAGIAWVE